MVVVGGNASVRLVADEFGYELEISHETTVSGGSSSVDAASPAGECVHFEGVGLEVVGVNYAHEEPRSAAPGSAGTRRVARQERIPCRLMPAPSFEPFEGDAPDDAPSVVARRARRVRATLDHRDAFWPAQLAVGCAILLYLTLPDKVTVGPTWLLPSVEGVLLVGLVIATPHPRVRYSARRRHVAIGLIALVSLVSLASLMLLVHYLLKGGKAGGHPLILAGVVLWLTNVLLFSLWYWELDRGGPVARALDRDRRPDFLFVQMTEPSHAPDGWLPGFVDYLYLSFTNATAFSPTDTMPLTASAKALMTLPSLAALVTVGLVVARAVNILG